MQDVTGEHVPVLGHDESVLRASSVARSCPIPGLEVFTVRLVLPGPVSTPDGIVEDGDWPVHVWVRGIAPAGLVPGWPIRLHGLMLGPGPVFWAEALEVVDADHPKARS